MCTNDTLLLKAREKAARLYPDEVWLELEPHIFIAANRRPKNKNQRQTLEKELIQARILAKAGSVIYLLPETPVKDYEKHPDAVVDGFVMEFKTITGGIRQIEERFKESRLKADRVFLKIDAPLTKEAVIKKLESVILQKLYDTGQVIAYFTDTQKLYFWNIADLVQKVSGSEDPAGYPG